MLRRPAVPRDDRLEHVPREASRAAMHGGPPLRAELLEGVVELHERRVRVQRKIRARALAVVIPCNICLGRPVHVGENRLTFISLWAVERLAVALVFYF